MVKDQSSLQRLRLSTRCRNGPCTESGEGGCPPIDVGNGVTTESAPNIWRWRTAVEHYVGIDVSLELSSVCVVDGRGKIVKEAKVASEPEALVYFFKELGFPVNRIGFEAGPLLQLPLLGLIITGFQTLLSVTRHLVAGLLGVNVKTNMKDAGGAVPLAWCRWVPQVDATCIW